MDGKGTAGEVAKLENRRGYVQMVDWREGEIMKKIKPCPFCGSHDVVSGRMINPTVWWDSGMRGEDCGFVMCLTCGACVKGEYEEEAIEAWNRRANDE